MVGWVGEGGSELEREAMETHKPGWEKSFVGGEGGTLKRLYFLNRREPERIHFPQASCFRCLDKGYCIWYLHGPLCSRPRPRFNGFARPATTILSLTSIPGEERRTS